MKGEGGEERREKRKRKEKGKVWSGHSTERRRWSLCVCVYARSKGEDEG